LRLLLRATPEIVFCFDGDRAGREAAWRAAENALPMLGGNHQLKFMFLPDSEDPDSVVRAQGADAFNDLVDNAQNYSDFFFSTLEKQVDISSMDGRARLVEIAKPFLRHIPAGVYRDMIEQQLANRAQTSAGLLNKHLEKPQAKHNKTNKKPARTANTISPIRMAITILLQHPELASEVENDDRIATLTQPGIKILVQMLETLRQNPHLNTAALLERARGSSHSEHLQQLAQQVLPLNSDELKPELLGMVEQLQRQAIEQRHAELVTKPLSELSAAEREELLNKTI